MGTFCWLKWAETWSRAHNASKPILSEKPVTRSNFHKIVTERANCHAGRSKASENTPSDCFHQRWSIETSQVFSEDSELPRRQKSSPPKPRFGLFTEEYSAREISSFKPYCPNPCKPHQLDGKSNAQKNRQLTKLNFRESGCSYRWNSRYFRVRA